MKTRLIPGLTLVCSALAVSIPPVAAQENQAQQQQPTPRQQETRQQNENAGAGQNPGQAGNTGAAAGARQTALTEQDRKFIMETAREGMKEVAVAQLAVSKAERPEVRELASQLVRDHTASNQELMAIAQNQGIPAPGDANNQRGGTGNTGAATGGAGNSGTGTGGTGAAGETTGTTGSTAGGSRVDPGDPPAPPAGTGAGTGGVPATPPPPSGGPPSGTPSGTATPGGIAPNTTTPLNTTGDTGASTAQNNNNTVPSDADNAGTARHHQEELKQLQAKSGREFDEAFLKEMERCHAKDIQSFVQAKSEVSNPRLKGYIDKTLPTLRAHASRIEALQKQE